MKDANYNTVAVLPTMGLCDSGLCLGSVCETAVVNMSIETVFSGESSLLQTQQTLLADWKLFLTA